MGTRADEAMARYARGEDAAFTEVFAAVAPEVQALALRELRDPMLAEDVVQHTLLNMHRARGSFLPGSAVMPWANTIARRLVADVRRRKWRDRRLESAVTVEPRVDPTAADESLGACESAARLGVAIGVIPEGQRRVVCLRNQGLSLAEIARELGTTVIAVKLRLHRAVSSLRAALADGNQESTESRP